jgi:predicted Rossmann fold flavoprotein
LQCVSGRYSAQLRQPYRKTTEPFCNNYIPPGYRAGVLGTQKMASAPLGGSAHGSDPIVVVGAGAAGLMTAITAARLTPGPKVVVLDGARRLGAKILISGGGRCNVTNRSVGPEDFNGGSPRAIARVLRALPVEATVRFFEELGVSLHEEARGKLFPDSNRAATVLDALLGEAARAGVQMRHPQRVEHVRRTPGGFCVATDAGPLEARYVVLASGGLSVPKTGSDGRGHAIARALGHTIVPTTPALAPLLLDGTFHQQLSGVSQPVEMMIRSPGVPSRRILGDLLWTHFGASGPGPLDASRHWHRAAVEGRPVAIDLSLRPGERFESVDAQLVDAGAARPRAAITGVLAAWLPASVAAQLVSALGLDPASTMAHVPREDRRRLVHALTTWPLPVTDSRGFNYAEATAGGVPLEEIDPATMESRVCRGLYLAGELLDVDGRLGGFNFQWAWASGYVAGRGCGRGV